MISKNNQQYKLQQQLQQIPHFGIRKLSVGVASVLIGLSFMGMNVNSVKADSTKLEEEGQDTFYSTIQETQVALKSANNNSADTMGVGDQAGEQTQVFKLADSEAKSDYIDDTTLQDDKVRETEELPKLSPVNVNDWQYNTDGNQDINLTNYIGNDKVNIIIPNDQDFVQAGKFNAGHAVKISSSVMHDIMVKEQPQSIIISKNNNGKVVAADADWSNAFGGDSTSQTGYTSGILLANPKLKALDLTNLDTHNITDFSQMFYYGSNLTTVGDLSNWDVSNGKSFARMFRNASSLTSVGDLSNWDVSKGTDFTGMFNQARHIKSLGNLSGWNVANSKSFANMFRDTWNLYDIGDISNWNVANSKSTEWMFGNSALNRINISGWNLSNTTNFSNMFQGEPFKEVYNDSTKLWIPQTVHHDKIIIANDLRLPENAINIINSHDFAGGE